MGLDLSWAALVNAAGGLLFLLVGIAALAWGPRDAGARRVGAYAASFGFLYVVQNTLVLGAPFGIEAFLNLAAGLAHVAASLALAAWLSRGLAGRARNALLAFLAANVVVVAVAGIGLLSAPAGFASRDLLPEGLVPRLAVAFLIASAVGIFAVTAAAGLRLTSLPAGRPDERRALTLLALSTGLFNAFLLTSINLEGAIAFQRSGAPWLAAALLAQALLLLPLLWFFRPAASIVPRLSRLAGNAFLVVGCAGVATAFAVQRGADASAYGAYGIVRTIGALFLALAILRYRLVDVNVPDFAARRGPLAMAVLGVLFIVAQVAQNFFAARYGLLIGGITAGAFLFAAYPIQRSMERLAERSSRPGTGPNSATQMEAAYRAALRAAMRDGILTRREELHLADMAELLGIGNRRAVELAIEVSAETPSDVSSDRSRKR